MLRKQKGTQLKVTMNGCKHFREDLSDFRLPEVIHNQAGSLELFRQPWFVLYYDLLALYKPAGGTGNVRMVGKEVKRGSTQQLPRWRC